MFKNIFSFRPKIENISIQRLIPSIRRNKIDTLSITTSSYCSTCKKYNRKVYSLYGWNKKYPVLPEFLFQRQCPDCDYFIGATIFYPGIAKKPRK